MQLIPKDLYYLLVAMIMWTLTLVLVPRERYKPLFGYGLIWGFLASYIFAWIFGVWLRCFEYQLMKPFNAFGVNLWLSIAWIASFMIYLHHLPSGKRWYSFPLYVLIFALASASLDECFHQSGLLKYYFWHPGFRFVVAIVWFWGAKVHYCRTKGVEY